MTEFDAFIWKMAYRYKWACCRGPLGMEDLVQVGRMAEMEALASYDPTRGPRAVHVTCVIQQRMLKVAREDSGPVRVPEGVAKDLEIFAEEFRQAVSVDTQETDADVAKAVAALEALPPRRRTVVQMWMREQTSPEVAALLQVSPRRARQLQEKSMAKLRELLSA